MSHALLKAPTHADTIYPVGSVFTEKAAPAANERRLDIANNNINGPNTVVLKPVAVNIYYGAAWTLAQRNLMDFFTTNLGTTPYYSTLQTLKDKTGATISPLSFYGSFYDNTPDATVVFGQNALTQIQAIMQAYINAKAIGGTAIDITTVDFTNTIFNFITSPQVQFTVTGACGYHGVMTLSSNPANPATTNDLKLLYTVNAASLCNPFTGGYTNGQGGTAIIPFGAAPNDVAADGVLGTLVHELVATISDPMRDNNGKGTQSWYNNDDVRFSETNTPTYTTTGNYNENADLCAWSYGLDVTKLYNTRNPNNVATADAQGQYSFNANFVVAGRYFLIPQNYVYSPPNSQCAMSASAIVPLPAAYSTMSLSFVNGLQNSDQYYVVVLYYTTATTWRYAWKGPSVAFGKTVTFTKSFPTGTSFAGYRVVRVSDNKIVAANDLLPIQSWKIDNTNSQTVVVWSDPQNNVLTAQLGPSGTYTTSNVVVFNAAYPMLKGDDIVAPTITVLDAAKKPVTATSSSVKTLATYSANQNQPRASNQFLTNTYVLSPGSNNVLDISACTFTCGFKTRETLTFQAAAGTQVAAGTTTFVFCFDNPTYPMALYTPETNTLVTAAAQTLTQPFTGTVTTGYLALTTYSESTCKTTPQIVTYLALGQCVQTGMQRSVIRSAILSNGVYTFTGTAYASTNCDPTTAGPGLQSEGLDTVSSVCQANSVTGNTFQTATYVATLPTLPTGQLTRSTYSNAATCAAGTAPLVVNTFTPDTCSAYFGNSYQLPKGFYGRVFTSKTGGYLVQSFYGSAGCQGLPLMTNVNQVNVCGQVADSGSIKVIPRPLAGSVTAFQTIYHTSNDCSGESGTTALTGTFNAEYVVSQANTTMICAPSGLKDPNLAYVTAVFTPTVAHVAFFGFKRYNSLAGCNKNASSTFFSSTRFYNVGTCLQDPQTASNYVSVSGLGTGNTVPTTVTSTYSFQGISLATAQSSAFVHQSKFLQMMAAFVGVPLSSVSVTSVTAQGACVNVAVAIVAVNLNLGPINGLLASAGPAIINALAPIYPGISLCAAPTSPTSPTPAPSSTAWATPGNISGVVIGGVVAIVLIVLLSVLIPRMQHYRQQQVFGQGFPSQPQQLPPDAFYTSSAAPQQMEAGVQMGGKVVSF